MSDFWRRSLGQWIFHSPAALIEKTHWHKKMWEELRNVEKCWEMLRNVEKWEFPKSCFFLVIIHFCLGCSMKYTIQLFRVAHSKPPPKRRLSSLPGLFTAIPWKGMTKKNMNRRSTLKNRMYFMMYFIIPTMTWPLDHFLLLMFLFEQDIANTVVSPWRHSLASSHSPGTNQFFGCEFNERLPKWL